MAATLDEHQQFVSEGGKPLVGGKAFYGDPGADPVTVPKAIFSDPALTIPLANPQDLDAEGRTVNKVYIDGKYSILVENVLGGQEYQNLFNGVATASIATIILSNIIGADTIAATAGITAYVSNQQFVFKTISGVANDGPVTLDVDNIGARSIVKNQNQEIVKGEFEGDQTVIVAYNETIDKFEWTNQNNKVIDFYTGTPVASASTTDIWESTDGNAIHITGDTNITSFGTAPNIGARKTLIFDGTPLISNGPNLILPGGLDFVAAVNDKLEIFANTTTQFIISTPARGSLPRGHLAGLRIGNGDGVLPTPGGDTAHDITVQPGDAAASNNAGDLAISSALTKQIDATFAAGNNAGGLAASLTVANDTWYPVFIVDLTAGGSDVGFDTSLTAVNLLASTGVGTKFRRLGSVLTDGSSNIIAFRQMYDRFYWLSPPLVSSAFGLSATLRVIDTPLDVEVVAHLVINCALAVTVYVRNPDFTDLQPSLTVAPLASQDDAGGNRGPATIEVLTNTLSQVTARTTSASVTVRFVTLGWTDFLGRGD